MPIIAALVLLGGAGVAAWQLWPDQPTTAAQPPSSSAAATQSTTPSTTTATPSETPSATATKSPTPNPSTVKAERALKSCKAKVAAAEDVIKEAKTGVGHWASHIESQRLADEGKIDIDEMKARFKATRLKGPADQKRYRDAVNEYKDQDGSCAKVEDAPKTIAASLAKCDSRSSAQDSVMKAGDEAMQDWSSHLAAMQRNKQGHVNDPQGVWIRAYRAAPTNINAFKKATDKYDPPSC